jgi:hypothetical protein
LNSVKLLQKFGECSQTITDSHCHIGIHITVFRHLFGGKRLYQLQPLALNRSEPVILQSVICHCHCLFEKNSHVTTQNKIIRPKAAIRIPDNQIWICLPGCAKRLVENRIIADVGKSIYGWLVTSGS